MSTQPPAALPYEAARRLAAAYQGLLALRPAPRGAAPAPQIPAQLLDRLAKARAPH